MRILVTGKQGQVVSALLARSADLPDIELITIGRPEIDMADLEGLRAAVIEAKPDIIFSVAAYTQVDKAESEPDLAHLINAEAPGILAKAAAQLNIPLLHLSTDYVFAGDKPTPYGETDPTGPKSVYGQTKLDGELIIAQHTDNHVILRTAWVYSPFGHNFVKTMLRLAETRDQVNVVADQKGCPTSAIEIARALLEIAQRVVNDPSPALRGTFHLTAQGEANWHQFAQAVFDGLNLRGGKSVTALPITTDQYPTPAKRPANSRLSGEKLFATYGLKLDHWTRSLDQCLDHLISNHSDSKDILS